MTLAVTDEQALRCDYAFGTDPKNVKSVFHGPDLPFRPGASLRARLRIKTSEPAAQVGLDWKNDDFRLRPESPAFKLGFQAIPVEKIGIRPE